MIYRKSLLPLCAALLLMPTIASAAPAPQHYDPDEGANVTEGSDGTRHIEILDGDSIEGEKLQPGGVNVRGMQGKKHASMISIRGEFIPELLKLATDI